MMPLPPLTPDQLMAIIRSLRKRLDLTKPVEMSLIEECVELAMQVPTARSDKTSSFWWSATLKKTLHREVI